MHERKALMASLAHGFIALPGGFGTQFAGSPLERIALSYAGSTKDTKALQRSL